MDEHPRDSRGRFAPGQPPPTVEHRAKMVAGKAAKNEIRDGLLKQAGLEPETAQAVAPELWIAANKAAKGDMPALKFFLSQTKQLVKESKAKPEGEVYNIVLSQESVEYLVEHGMKFTLCEKCDRKHE